ncbi:MAG: TadE family protein [Chloroflexales bacterium]
MFRHRHAKRSRGQALVEFALAGTLIFTLLSAAVDLGLIFFSLQALRVAAQEGASFGSHPVMVMNGADVLAVDLPYAQIVDRVRRSGGDAPRGIVNLLDLNNDGVDDSTQGGNLLTYNDPNSYIYIQNLKYVSDALYDPTTGAPLTPSTCATNLPRQQMRGAGQFCYVKVTVSYDYKFIFPLAPVFGSSVRLKTSFLIHVRSSFIG